ncbi:MAG TPA: nitroreductase family protein [Pseudomonadales bacterium]|nr:nitroreductase family protein [Pseudomonadales bacterium]
MDLIQGILTRSSNPKLVSPAPQPEQLNTVIRCGARAPDHGRMRPWRFVVVEGEGLAQLGAVFEAATLQDNPQAETAALARARSLPLRAPMIIMVAAVTAENPKVPRIEQIIAAGAAAQNIQLALHALGYGCMWRTGAMAAHPHVKSFFKLKSEDEIVGFLYVGTIDGEPRAVVEEAVENYLEFMS